MSELRKKILAKTKRVVVKVGSRLLVDLEAQKLNTRFISRLVGSLIQMREDGIEVVLVSSGAVGAGMALLGHSKKPNRIEKKQAYASVGQVRLMQAYENAFSKKGFHAGQVLLGAEDFRSRERYGNIRNTVQALLDEGVFPVINENDSVSVNEIKVGDNDKLSADVSQFLDADLLVILTDEDGLYDCNPKKNPDAQLKTMVHKVDAKIMHLADSSQSAISTGGMKSKLEAIKQATDAGSHAFLANGFKILPHRILSGLSRGTFFLANEKKLSPRNRWISYVSTAKGKITVDAGAVKALRNKNASLLPVGVTRVAGKFLAGDLVDILDANKKRIARGIAKISAESLEHLKGIRTKDMGRKGEAHEAVHKDDLVLL